jgi:hypothetical protein
VIGVGTCQYNLDTDRLEPLPGDAKPVDFRAYLEKAFQYSKRQVHPGDCVQVIRWGCGRVESIEGGRVKVRNTEFGATGAVIYAPYARCKKLG